MTGEHLAKRIKAAQLSQKELADRMNVIPQLVSSMCKTKSVGSEKLEMVCKALGKPMNFLYEGTHYYEKVSNVEGVIKFGEDNSEIISTLIQMLKTKDEENIKLQIRLQEKEDKISSLHDQNMKISMQLFKKESFEKTEGQQKVAEP